MRAWWMNRGVNTVCQARTYLQEVGQSSQPEELFGELTLQIVEDIFQAGGASDYIAHDLLCQSERSAEQDFVQRIRDHLNDQQHWGNADEWLCNAAWLAVSMQYRAALEPIINHMGMDAAPFSHLNGWLFPTGHRKRTRPIQVDRRHQQPRSGSRANRRQRAERTHCAPNRTIGTAPHIAKRCREWPRTAA